MSILKRLEEEGIVSFKINEDKTKLRVLEMNHMYYRAKLSRSEITELIDELTELRDQMVEEVDWNDLLNAFEKINLYSKQLKRK
jgi:hypothetical protein